MPSRRSAWASRADRRASSAKLCRRVPSPVLVTTSLSRKAVVPYRMIDVTVSGTSIIVLRTDHRLVVSPAVPAHGARSELSALIFPQAGLVHHGQRSG